MHIPSISFSTPTKDNHCSHNIRKQSLEWSHKTDSFPISFKGNDVQDELQESLEKLKYKGGDYVFHVYGPTEIAYMKNQDGELSQPKINNKDGRL